MSLQNFIPTIWSAKILNTFEISHVLAGLCNNDYEGEISDMGDSVKINTVGPITVSAYVKNSSTITPEELSAPQTVLNIDQADSFSFYIDDVDKAQANVSVMNKAMSNAGYAMSDSLDVKIGLLYDQAANTVTDATFDAALALDTIALAAQYLSEAGVPKTGRWLVLPPWAVTKLVLSKILNTEGSVDANLAFVSGFVGKIMGFNVFESNNLYQTGTAPNYTTRCIAGVQEAITLAEQIVHTEAFRPEASFSDAMKGLHVYGYKVVQPEGLVQLVLTYAAETT